jgi:hypothetical protein
MDLGGGQVTQASHNGLDVQIGPVDAVIANRLPSTWPPSLNHPHHPWRNHMTSQRPIPPLPPPPQPAQAARSLAEAALAAAGAWAQPLDPARHGRALSQLYSVLRDLGIATRGLAQWVPADMTPDIASAEFARHVASGARWLLSARDSLDDVPASEGAVRLPDPDEPGAALCHAARRTVLAWRHPSGSTLDRDTALRQLIAAIGFLSDATAGLATCAPWHRAIDLQSAGASLAGASASLAAAIQESCPGPAAGAEQYEPGGAA